MEAKKNNINIPNVGQYELEAFIEDANRLRKEKWEYKIWVPTPALIEKLGGLSTQYIGQTFNSKYFDLVMTGWTHDHCEFCSKVISDFEEDADIDGYVSDNNWLCKDCYDVIVKPINIETAVKNLQVEG